MVKEPQWKVLVNHRADLLSQDLILTGIFQHSHFKEFGFSFDFPYVRYAHDTGDISWHAEQVWEIRSTMLSIGAYEKLIADIEHTLASYRAYAHRFDKRVRARQMHPAALEEFFTKSAEACGSIARFVLSEGVENALAKEGVPMTAVRSSKTDVMRAADTLARLAHAYAKELEKSSSEDAHALSGRLRNALKKFCARFGYLGMKYFKGHPWTIREAYQMLCDAGRYAASKPHGVQASAADAHAYHSKYLPIAEALLRLRTEKWEALCYGTYLFRKAVMTHFSDMAEYDELLSYRMDEAMHILKGQLYASDIAQQRASFVMEITDSAVELRTQAHAAQSEAQATVRPALRGQCAFGGTARGAAKVVLHPRDCVKIEEGDILVATMSTPDFLGGMLRASAFVTDIGGITSHAAIVAREMKKPCVIGTKDATKVLKDGDLIEVDADKGQVKLLQRKK